MPEHEHMWLGLDAIGLALALGGGGIAMGLWYAYAGWRLERRVKALEKALTERPGEVIRVS
jgi:hypothetical protein